MSIVISTSPSRTRDGNSSNFIAVDNGVWFEFQANGSPVESSMRLNIVEDDDTPITTTDIILNFSSVDNKVYFDAAPYLQSYLRNQNENTYTDTNEQDNDATQGFKLIYGVFPEPSPTDETTTAVFYALKSALEYGNFYGQNMAEFVPFTTQVNKADFLTPVKTLRYYDNYPIDLSYISNNIATSRNVKEYLNNALLSNTTTALTAKTIIGTSFLNFLKSNSNADKIEVTLTDAYQAVYSMLFDGVDESTTAASTTSTYNFIHQTNIFTISTWVKLTDYTDPTAIFFIGSSGASGLNKGFGVAYRGATNKMVCSVDVGVAGQQNVIVMDDTVTDNNWHSVIFTVNTASTIKAYLDGVESSVTIEDAIITGTGDATNNLQIGGGGNLLTNLLDGNLTNLSIWDTFMSAAEVAEIWNGGTVGDLDNHSKAANLQAWFKLGDGDTFGGGNWTNNDSSTNAKTATSTNMEEVDRVEDVP